MTDDEVKVLCDALMLEHEALLHRAGVDMRDPEAMLYSDGKPVRKVKDITSPNRQAADMLQALASDNARLRADAQAAVALAVKGAAEMAREGFMIVAPEGIGQRQALDSYRAQISANILTLADTDSLAMVEELRKERDEWKAVSETLSEMHHGAESRADRLSADLAAAQAQIETLRDILHDAGALRDAADRVSEWFCTEARHLEGPRVQALRTAMVAYDRRMQPTALPAKED